MNKLDAHFDNEAYKWLGEHELGYDIWDKKYRHNNESFSEWVNRVSNGSAEVAQLIRERKFLFGGRILANRGIEGKKVTYSNCYVLPAPEDNLESIFDTAKLMARTFSYGGGVGIDVSNLRPEGANVENSAHVTSGPCSFMDFYSYVTGTISQGSRRGALMLSISDHHPDLMQFIKLKSDLSLCTKANISVRVSDEFMEAVVLDDVWELYFDMEDGSRITKTMKAKELFHELCKQNWNYAEPGMLMWDNIENYNLMADVPWFHYAGTNPCAEEPLPAGGSCSLSSINLGEFVTNPYTDKAEIDYDGLCRAVSIAVIAQNEVLDEGLPKHPLKIQQETVRDLRQIGVGVMGLADMFIKYGVEYGSEESIALLDMVMKRFATAAVQTSVDLANVHGAFPKCDKSVREAIANSKFIKHLGDKELERGILKYGMRNSQLLCVAPTGTTGTMLNISTGVEPYFAKSYTRRTVSLNGKDTYHQVDIKPIQEGADPTICVTSEAIAPIDRIKVQSVLQGYIDASISSTINLPNSATIEDVEDIYMSAWRYGLKGVTIYRSGCAREGILTTKKEEPKVDDKCITPTSCPRRPKELQADLYVIRAAGNKYLVSVGLMCGRPYEIFANKLPEGWDAFNYREGKIVKVSKQHYQLVCGDRILDNLQDLPESSEEKSATLYASMLLRYGVNVAQVIHTANKVNGNIASFSAAMCRVLKKYVEKEDSKLICPECGAEMTSEGGCVHCTSCGFSRCE